MQTSAGAYAQNEIAWTPWLRTLAGVRADGYRFRVDASDPANSGHDARRPRQPEGRRWSSGRSAGTELYANAGLGFHSNDARGATITRDPSTGEPVEPVTPLVRATGAEVGVRTVAHPAPADRACRSGRCRLDSELVFVGDAGTTEAGPPEPSLRRRVGELLSSEAVAGVRRRCVAVARALHRRRSGGRRIPGSVETRRLARRHGRQPRRTSSAACGCATSARARWSKTIRSGRKRPALVNLEGGYRFSKRMRIAVDVFNLLDAKASDIDYFYPSRLPRRTGRRRRRHSHASDDPADRSGSASSSGGRGE